jgi:hypothetical protein
VLFSSAIFYAEWTLDNCREALWFNGSVRCALPLYEQLENSNKFKMTPSDGSPPVVVSCVCAQPNPYTR